MRALSGNSRSEADHLPRPGRDPPPCRGWADWESVARGQGRLRDCRSRRCGPWRRSEQTSPWRSISETVLRGAPPPLEVGDDDADAELPRQLAKVRDERPVERRGVTPATPRAAQARRCRRRSRAATARGTGPRLRPRAAASRHALSPSRSAKSGSAPRLRACTRATFSEAIGETVGHASRLVRVVVHVRPVLVMLLRVRAVPRTSRGSGSGRSGRGSRSRRGSLADRVERGRVDRGDAPQRSQTRYSRSPPPTST